MRVFYVRCSTVEQNEARQLKMAEEQNAEKVFVDKASGKNLAASEGRDAYLRPGVLEADNGQIGLSDMVDELRESARGSSRDAVSRDISHGVEAI